MSHFTCLVVTEEKPTDEILSRVLQPYCEDTSDLDESLIEFEDVTEDYLTRYNNNNTEFLRFPSGASVCKWSYQSDLDGVSRNFRNIGSSPGDPDYYEYEETFVKGFATEEEAFKFSYEQQSSPSNMYNYLVRKGNLGNIPGTFGFDGNFNVFKVAIPESFLEEFKVPLKEVYSTFEEYMEDYCGEKPKENGRYGYWNNPKAKWDWWAVGGRWSGYLQSKPDSTTEIGEFGLMDSHYSRKGNACDMVQVQNLDTVAMLEENRNQRKKWWLEAELEYRKRDSEQEEPLNISFSEALEEKEKYSEEISSKLPKDMPFWRYLEENLEDPIVKRFDRLQKALPFFNPDGKNLEEYVNNAETISTFSFINDKGQWFDRGSMGWWGIVTEEKEEDSWEKTYQDFIKELNPKHWVTLIDCHI